MASTIHSDETAVAEKQEIKEPSLYNVVVHNNDDTSYEEVVYIISKAFEMSEEDAFKVAQKVDSVGRGICGAYSKEIAETKLYLVEMIKESLITLIPFRAKQINILKFTMEKA